MLYTDNENRNDIVLPEGAITTIRGRMDINRNFYVMLVEPLSLSGL